MTLVALPRFVPSAGLVLLALAGCRGKTAPVPPSSTDCAACHGSAGNAAPPFSTRGATSTADRGVGAHQTHVNPGPFRRAMSCDECHRVPASLDSPGHNDGKVDVVFGGLGTARGASPAWDPFTARCSATYCHGSTLHDGSNTTPQWTRVDGTQVACGTCHGVPPTWAGHPAVPVTSPVAVACATCHPGTVKPDGSLDLARGQHIDGVLQIGAAACTQCHGDVNRVPAALAPAPPLDSGGNTPTTALGVGAHQKHLTGTSLRSGPIACGECHVVPATRVGHPKPNPDPVTGAKPIPELTWGPLAKAGGAAPSWNRSNASCSATYCHGGTLAGGSNTAPTWTVVNGTQAACGTCHGTPPPQSAGHPAVPVTNPVTVACAGCHAGTVKPDGTLDAASGFHINGYVELGANGAVTTCTSCHGDPAKPVAVHAAPPRDVKGNTATTAIGVGAHETHLSGGRFSFPVACTECHPEVTRTDHAGAGPAFTVVMAWGPLATTGLSHPVWDRNAASCSSTYCHGSTLGGGVVAAPVWTRVDGTQTACGACHGVPPPAPHVARQDCGTCHAGYTSTSVNLATHIDGVVDAAGGSCTSCHGDATRALAASRAAPPLDTAGGSATSLRGVGAHMKHLNDGVLRRAVACDECHVVPAVSNHADGSVEIVFGRLAGTNGASPQYNPSASPSCSAVYCHGATLPGGTRTTPVWTQVDGTFTACGSCHAIPPPQASGHPASNGSDCGSCHTGYTAASVNVDLHINGTVDATGGTCTSCHGDATRVLVTGADPQTPSAPPRDAAGPWGATGAGAHLAHLNKGAGAIGAPVACAECHAVPATMGPSGTHQNGAADVRFGTLARTRGAAPVWVAASLSCSATYCHGQGLSGGTKPTPGWTQVGGLACNTCHAAPPADRCHPPQFRHGGGNSCNSCHKDTNSTGTAITDRRRHINGIVDGQCTDCHRNESCTP